MRNTRAKSFTRLNARVTLIGGFLLCLVLCPPVAAQVSYTVTDVGKVNDPGGGAGGINNRGAVVGQEILPGGTDTPMSITNVSAISAAPKTPRGRLRFRPAAEALSAGAKPNNKPAASDAPIVAKTTRRSSEIWRSRGTNSGASLRVARTPQYALL